MNQVARTDVTSPPSLLSIAPPKISPKLDMLVVRVKRSEPLDVPSKAVRAEAEQVSVVLEALCAPVGEEAIKRWLLPLSAGSDMPLTIPVFAMRAKEIAEALAHLPASIFTVATQRLAMTEFAYFPGVKSLNDFLMPLCRDYVRDRDAIRKILAIPVPPPPPELTQEERDAICDRLDEQLRDVQIAATSVQRAQEAAAPARASHVDPEHLARMRANDPLVQRAFAIQRELREQADAKAALAAAIVAQRAAPDRSAVRLPWDDAA